MKIKLFKSICNWNDAPFRYEALFQRARKKFIHYFGGATIQGNTVSMAQAIEVVKLSSTVLNEKDQGLCLVENGLKIVRLKSPASTCSINMNPNFLECVYLFRVDHGSLMVASIWPNLNHEFCIFSMSLYHKVELTILII